MHEKAMPVLLMDRKRREIWLEGPVEEALALQGPAPDAHLMLWRQATDKTEPDMPVAFTAAQIAEMEAKMKNLSPASPTKTGWRAHRQRFR